MSQSPEAKKDSPSKPKIKYEQVDHAGSSSDDEVFDALASELQDTEYNANNDTKKPKLYEISSCKDIWKWAKHKPCSKLPFFYFFISILIPPILAIYYISEPNSAYLVSGLFGTLAALYGMNHFRVLIRLKKEVDDFGRLNGLFKTENVLLSAEVNRIGSARDQLSQTRHKLRGSIQKQRENNLAFKQIQRNMQSVNLDNIEGITSIREKANGLNDTWTKTLHHNERKVLFAVFERFENRDDNIGMSKKEWEEFMELVPNVYVERFRRLGTFKKLSGEKGYVDYRDFAVVMDLFHEMCVKDIDIDFKIEVSETPRAQNEDMPQLFKQKDVLSVRHVVRLRETLPGQHFDEATDIE